MRWIAGFVLWILFGVLGLFAELWLYAHGRHAYPEIVQANLSNRRLRAGMFVLCALIGPIQIVLLVASMLAFLFPAKKDS